MQNIIRKVKGNESKKNALTSIIIKCNHDLDDLYNEIELTRTKIYTKILEVTDNGLNQELYSELDRKARSKFKRLNEHLMIYYQRSVDYMKELK